MAAAITIRKLDPQDRDLILKIANWYFNEWQTPVDKTIHRLTNPSGDDVLFQLVLAQDSEVVATGGLCNQVNILNVYPELATFKPWVALLYTDQDYRNQGLGRLLLEQLEHCARESKLTKIYLYTFTAESLYRRCGWKQIERVVYKDKVVMEKEL